MRVVWFIWWLLVFTATVLFGLFAWDDFKIFRNGNERMYKAKTVEECNRINRIEKKALKSMVTYIALFVVGAFCTACATLVCFGLCVYASSH